MPEEWLHEGLLLPRSSLWQDDFCSARHEKHSGTVKWANQQWCGGKVSVYTNKCKKKDIILNMDTVGGLNVHILKEQYTPITPWLDVPTLPFTTRQQQVNNKRSNNATPCGIRFNHTWQANTVSHNGSKPALVKLGAYIYLIKKSAI